ncbi:hypothetical protein [Clostridium polynesiense]|uniref:hypothetical protein n=1 Tax=Clostridium polynesiense TaxID=1325933 RepID=UPI00058C3731|nr:hypothetical protein [Clostridium polynesiense]
MDLYYVNKNVQTNGDHEVHKSTCGHKPNRENSLYLGAFNTCKNAVKEAKKYYIKSNGCYYCCNECHTS